jgi:hypothetical protein
MVTDEPHGQNLAAYQCGYYGHKSKQSGKLCRAKVIRGRTACQMHGGKSPRGFAHPNTKTGRYSQDLVARAVASYEQGLVDSTNLELGDEVALSTTLIKETLHATQLPKYWAELHECYESVCQLYIDGLVFLGEQPTRLELAETLARPEGGALGRALGELGERIAEGEREYSLDIDTVDRTSRLLEGKRRLVESELKRFSDNGLLWPISKVQLYVGKLLSCVRRHITDESVLMAIARDFQADSARPRPVDSRRADGSGTEPRAVATTANGSASVDTPKS